MMSMRYVFVGFTKGLMENMSDMIGLKKINFECEREKGLRRKERSSGVCTYSEENCE